MGAHLANAAAAGECKLFYWRPRNREVDFVAKAGRRVVALEAKSARVPRAHAGMDAFADEFGPDRMLLVGGDGIDVGEFLSRPLAHWLSG